MSWTQDAHEGPCKHTDQRSPCVLPSEVASPWQGPTAAAATASWALGMAGCGEGCPLEGHRYSHLPTLPSTALTHPLHRDTLQSPLPASVPVDQLLPTDPFTFLEEPSISRQSFGHLKAESPLGCGTSSEGSLPPLSLAVGAILDGSPRWATAHSPLLIPSRILPQESRCSPLKTQLGFLA